MRLNSLAFLKRCIRKIMKIALYIAVPFSPLIVWFILTLNRELIELLARSSLLFRYFPKLSVTIREDVFNDNFIRAFNSSALSGLLTLFGVIVTVWYYYSTRQQDLTERQFFVIDELIAELKKNRREIELLNKDLQYSNNSGTKNRPLRIRTEAWHKLGADVALLPRRMHMRLGILYGCLLECQIPEDYLKRKVTIDKITDLITDLHKYRSQLGKREVV